MPGKARSPSKRASGRLLAPGNRCNKMKILLFLNLRLHETAGKLWTDEAYLKFWLAVAEKFDELIICAPCDDKPVAESMAVELPPRVKIRPLPMYRSSFELYAKFPLILAKVIGRIRPELPRVDAMVAVVPNPLGMCLSRLARLKGIPSIFYIRGNLKQTIRTEYDGTHQKWLVAKLAGALDLIARRMMKTRLNFVVGQELAKIYGQHGLASVPLAVSLLSRAEIHTPQGPWREKGPFNLLSVGRLSREKGLDVLLRALDSLDGELKGQLKCTLVGEGPERGKLEKLCSRMDLGFVEMPGFVNDGSRLRELYRESDLFVMSSHTEGLPKVALEAMAYGCPIVSTEVGGLKQLLEDGRSALLVPPGRTEALAEAITRALTNSGLRRDLAMNAHRTVLEYTMERQRDLFVSQVESYTGSRARTIPEA